MQRGLCLFLPVCATQLLPTLRPAAGSVNVNTTLAASLRTKENVVPSGGRLFLALVPALLICASALPSRQVVAVSATWLRTGATGAATTGGSGAGTVTVRVVVAAASAPQYAVRPVKTSVLEQPASSVTVSVTV